MGYDEEVNISDFDSDIRGFDSHHTSYRLKPRTNNYAKRGSFDDCCMGCPYGD